MTPPNDRWAVIREIFDGLSVLEPHQREPLIAAAALDAAERAELQSLLDHHDASILAQGFMSESASEMLESSEVSRVGLRMGAWEIMRQVGEGGMGEVFEARRADGSYEGRAAIKLLKRGMDSAAVLGRFAQERQALARLTHPHIARLLDAGTSTQGLPYFVLEFVDGQPIDQAVQGLTLEARLALFLQLADAVAYAHRSLLVHRDLKPGNVMVDRDGQVKLLDFGIAKALDPLEGKPGDVTQGGQRPYTPNYASPEQVRGEPLTTATDIYSLGVLLYLMLTGTRPTGRDSVTPADAARSVLEDAPTRPSRLSAREALDPTWVKNRKALEGDLDNVLLKSLEKSPERRYSSVESMAADVKAYLGGYAVSARTPSTGYVLYKFVSRNRWAVAIAGISVVSVLVGLATALTQRNLAELRYAQVRKISNSFIFKYNDAIESLPGSLAVRRQLLEDALRFLDDLSSGSTSDPEMAVEQAAGYRKVAHALYNGRNLAHVGDKAGSLVASGKARALIESALSKRPGDPGALTQLAQLEADEAAMQGQDGQLDASILKFDSAISRLESVVRTNPRNAVAGFELSYALMAASLVQSKRGQPATGYLERASEAFDRWAALKPDHPDVMTLRQLLLSRKFMNAVGTKDQAGAVAIADQEIALYEANLKVNPDNFLYRRALQTAFNNQGAVLNQMARHAEALVVLGRGLEQGAALLKADSQSLDARLYLARTYFHRGKAQFALDQQAAAKNDFLQSEDTFREIGSRSVTPLYIRQRGENLFWLAKTCKLLQQTICLSQANRELLVLAGQQPQVFGSDPAAGWVTEVQGWVQK